MEPGTAQDTPPTDAVPTDADTRDRILRAGMECVTRFGRAKTTMQDVAAAAGLSRATLYRHFADRGALFNGIREFERERDLALITERAERTRTLAEAVAVVAEVLAATGTRYRMGEHLAAGDESLARFLALRLGRERERVAELIRPYVRRADAAGELRAGVSATEAEEWIALGVAQVGSLTGLRSVDVRDPAAVGRWLGRMTCAGVCADA
ncbi:TetR/AcrR family transcriptional regulator [Trujillonella endophytica]|uniref:TetR/AcrR family transcriptional regulator n=1 Tax=Trujillonella endophytica TaxID=673521 RepID=UPI00147AF020|nr:TetR/AcrR family transcriptional regulator [Trujillella endophytica]